VADEAAGAGEARGGARVQLGGVVYRVKSLCRPGGVIARRHGQLGLLDPEGVEPEWDEGTFMRSGASGISRRDVQGVIAAAPALSVPNTSPVLATLAKLLSPVLPHLVISPNFDLSGFSRDPEEVQKLLDDPLTDPRLSPRLAVETLSALEWTQAHAADLQVPLLLIHGDADPITPAEGSLAFFKNVKIEDKALKLYEGGYHQAFIDSNREQVLADVAEWLDQHA
jgi:alpha-beta hydrolase superfamily lysophospholipase